MLGLLHLFLSAPRWEAGAMERAKQMYISHYRSLGKGLERATDRPRHVRHARPRQARAAWPVLSCMLDIVSQPSAHELDGDGCGGVPDA